MRIGRKVFIKNDLATYIAACGVFASIVALAWKVIRDLQDSANLVVKAQIVTHAIGFDGLQSNRVRIELVNNGKRPITVVEISYKPKASNSLVKIPDRGKLPHEINESQTFLIVVLPTDVGKPEKVEFVFARDALGRDHKSKRNPLRSHK